MVLPVIFMMTDKTGQIIPAFSVSRIFEISSFYMNPGAVRIFTFQRHVSFFLLQQNNQFVDSMYNESLPVSHIHISLLFRLASMPLTTQLYIHFTHIFSQKEIYFATNCDNNVITVQKFTSGQCLWGSNIVAPHPIDRR